MDQKFSDPLSAAVAKRDANVLETVREALKHGRTALAFQPVIQAGAPQNVVFYEGLIRIIDPAGRHIPARDFIAEVENTELGRLIDCATLQLGMTTLAKQPAVRLSINIYLNQFVTLNYCVHFRMVCASRQIWPETSFWK